MTRARNDSHSTEYGIWLRQQNELDSKKGFIATNLDYIWKNYKTGQYMYKEEKRFNSQLIFPQNTMFETLDKLAIPDPKYYGFHVIVFSQTNPEDGDIYLDNTKITKYDLIEFLQFKKTRDWYQSYFDKTAKKSVS